MQPKTPGQIAYEAWSTEDSPPWHELGPEQARWEGAALAVLRSAELGIPQPPPEPPPVPR